MKQTELERHPLAEAFVSQNEGEQPSQARSQEQTMMPEILVYFNKKQALGISFLLHHVPTVVVRLFSYNHLYSSNQEFWYKEWFSFMSIPKHLGNKRIMVIM